MAESNILHDIARGHYHTQSLRTLTFHLNTNMKQCQWYRNLTPVDFNWPLIMSKYNAPHDIAHVNYHIRTLRVIIFHLSTNTKQFQWHRKLTSNDLNWPLSMTKYNISRDVTPGDYYILPPRIIIFHLSTNLKQFELGLKLTLNDLGWPLIKMSWRSLTFQNGISPSLHYHIFHLSPNIILYLFCKRSYDLFPKVGDLGPLWGGGSADADISYFSYVE